MIVGLTGGIGSGKSAAADCFAALGVPVVDTDAIAHELTGVGGTAISALAAALGSQVIAADGSLNRAVMRHLAFEDAAVRRRLEAILHPMIRVESDRRCRAALLGGARYVLLVVPLLAESGDYRQRTDRIVVVDCADELRVGRVMARSGLARQEVERIMAAQATRGQRLAIADDIIVNDRGLDDLCRQVRFLHERYLASAADTRKS